MSHLVRALKLASGAGLLGALLASSGCSLLPYGKGSCCPTAEAPPPPAPVLPAPASAVEPQDAAHASSRKNIDRAELVNLFGDASTRKGRPTAASSETSFQQHTAVQEGYDGDVSVDPTGQWLTFSSTRHSEHPDIYLQRVGGSSVVQLTSDPADDAQPSFSPDGKQIAFCSNRGGTWDIYLMDVDGKSIEQVTDTHAHEMHPSFSPDGTRLVYCALSPRSDQWELWVIDLATRQRKTIGHGLFPAWSARKDVDRIAFQKARQRGSRLFSIWTVDLVENEPRRMTEVSAHATAASVGPTWSPDGQRLAFTSVSDPESPAQPAGRQDVWVVNADGSARQRLTDGLGTNLSPCWAVDNRVYFISDRGGHDNVWSTRIETSPSPRDHTPGTAHSGHGPGKTTQETGGHDQVGSTGSPEGEH